MCGLCEGTCLFLTIWYSNKCEVDMRIARTTTHCEERAMLAPRHEVCEIANSILKK